MTVTRKDLDTRYVNWFRNVWKLEEAKTEILERFSQEPEPYEWTEQDIYEQARKIIDKWSRAYSMFPHHDVLANYQISSIFEILGRFQ